MKNILCFMLIIMLCGCQSNQNKVDTGIYQLIENDVNDSYDITGDGNMDNIVYVKNSSEEGIYYSVDISINDEIMTLDSIDQCYEINVTLIQLEDVPFLWVNGVSDNGDDPFQCLYQYQNGKLVNVLQFDEIIDHYGYHTTTDITSITNNEMTIEQSCMSASLGRIIYDETYTYENNTFSRLSTTVQFDSVAYTADDEYGTIRNDIKSYKDSSLTQEAQILEAGTLAKPTSMDFDENHISIELTLKDNSTYWVAGTSEFDEENLILEECYYAG